MLSKVTSVALVGLQAIPIQVEVDIASQGLPSFIIVGLPDKSVDESKERVRASIKNSGFEFPNKKITINLAPSDVPKEGSKYDLPIALGILASSNQIPAEFENKIICGELSLDGQIRAINGSVLYTILAKELGNAEMYIPQANIHEAQLIKGPLIYGCSSLRQVVNHFNHQEHIPLSTDALQTPTEIAHHSNTPDMSEVYGQAQIKRALEISASGSHNVIMLGSPGSGKTLLARSFMSIMPPLTEEETLELTKLYSASNNLKPGQSTVSQRPFRTPHHTGSIPSIIGGGSNPKPGEISLAHRGVLFLDEFLEFSKTVIEALRQPLEDGQITVTRTAQATTFPARFILIAACNPCPCGYALSTDETKSCQCTPAQITNYIKKMSGPILDRIDLQVKVRAVPVRDLGQTNVSEKSETIKARVTQARDIQRQRFQNSTTQSNAEMSVAEIKQYCQLEPAAQTLLHQAVTRLGLSARGYNRTLKVARTIADLSNSSNITTTHIAETLQFRFS